MNQESVSKLQVPDRARFVEEDRLILDPARPAVNGRTGDAHVERDVEVEGGRDSRIETQWGLMISVFSLSHVPALLGLKIPRYEGRNLLLIAFLVLVVQSSDVLQYVWGKLLGRHQIVP